MKNDHPILCATALRHAFQLGTETISILQEIDVAVKAGESVAIIGASGSGKTTLLSLLAGIESPTHGEIKWGDHLITALGEDERAILRRDWVGFIFQDFQLLSFYTVLENVCLPLEIKGDGRALEKATHWLDAVGLSHRLKHLPSQLSGGEQQRVAIARAFAMGAKILFADEPTGNLDEKTGEKIMALLFSLQQQENNTLLVVTHDDRLASRCLRRCQLQDGHLLCP